MSYSLGIDLGTTYTAVALCRNGGAAIVELGDSRASIPSALFLTPEREWLAGDQALRRGRTEPNRLAVHFKRRFGDSTAIMVGGSPVAADALTSRLLRVVIDKTTALEGEAPTRVAITHPANWGPFKLDLLRGAATQAGVVDPLLISEPAAAALHYAAQERVAPGTVIAVYDLGGGTFDATVLRKDADGFAVLGRPDGVERLGGIDFDEAIFSHVLDHVPGLRALDPELSESLAVLQRVRADCVAAKESLSSDTSATISVVAAGLSTDVRITRAEFATLIAPMIDDTVAAMDHAITGAGLSVEQIDRLVLVGGSSRVPAVSEALAAAFGRPISTDVHPKHAVAIGAALATVASTVPPAELTAAESTDGVRAADSPPTSMAAVREFGEQPARRSRVPLLIGGVLAIAAVAGLTAISLGGGGTKASPAPTAAAPASPTIAQTTVAPAAVEPAAVSTQPLAPVVSAAPASSAALSQVPEQCKKLAENPRFGCIVGFSLNNKTVLVTYVGGESASLTGEYHMHFFGNAVAPEDAGAPSPEAWRDWDRPNTFAAQLTDPIWANSDKLCVLPAGVDHVVDPGAGHCVTIPADIAEAIASA
jgi:molecular chaperone DnaK